MTSLRPTQSNHDGDTYARLPLVVTDPEWRAHYEQQLADEPEPMANGDYIALVVAVSCAAFVVGLLLGVLVDQLG